MSKHTRDRVIAATLLMIMMPALAQAQSDSDRWEWRGSIYGWLPDLSMEAEFPSGATSSSITIDASTLIDNLSFTFMGTLQARKGQWGMFTDLIYMDESAHKSGSRDVLVGEEQLPAEVTLDLGIGMTSWVWTAAGTYNLVDSDRGTTDIAFGFRMLDIETSLDWSLNGEFEGEILPGPQGGSSVSGTNWDAIIGLRGVGVLGSSGRWHLPYHFDMGTGNSQFTWQAMLGVAYSFDWGEIGAAWRYMDYDFNDGDKLHDLTMNGPLVGASFSW